MAARIEKVTVESSNKALVTVSGATLTETRSPAIRQLVLQAAAQRGISRPGHSGMGIFRFVRPDGSEVLESELKTPGATSGCTCEQDYSVQGGL